MFNEELKRKFVNENYAKATTRNTALVGLNKSSKMEEELNKDLYEFTKEETIDFFKSPESGSYTTLETTLPYYRQYIKWVSKEIGIQNDCLNDYLLNLTLNDFKELLKDKIEKEKSRAISRKEILDICSTLKNPRDRAILLGTFEGISISDPNEFLEIRPEDVKENYLYLRSRNYNLAISKELSQYFKEAMNQDTYEYIGYMRGKKIDLIDGDEVALKIPKDINPDQSIRATIKKASALSAYKGDVTIPNLKYSGMADKLVRYMDEQELTLKGAYKVYRFQLMKEFNINRIQRPKIMGLAEFLIKEREEEKENG